MIISKDFESTILAAHIPNYIVLSEVEEYIDITYTAPFLQNEVSFRYTSFDGEVVLNIQEISKQIYGQILNYEDSFKYESNTSYGVNGNNHISYLDVGLKDSTGVELNKGVSLINSVLQITEKKTMNDFIDKRLGAVDIENFNKSDEFNFDLNFDL